MAKLRGIVLAAGRGVRMGGTRPKTLLPMGAKEPLLHYILAGLKGAGVDDLMVVTGFKSAEVQEYVGERWGEDVTYVFNARYASWGNFHTVRLALDQSPGMDCLITNSDIVVPADVYRRVAAAPGDLVLAVQRRPQHKLDAEDMRVELDGDRVRGIGKELKMARSRGEFAGVSLVRHPAALEYLGAATTVEWRGQTGLYYEDVYGAIMPGVDCRAAWVEEGEYAEVDDPEDVSAAVAVIEHHSAAWAAAAQPAASA